MSSSISSAYTDAVVTLFNTLYVMALCYQLISPTHTSADRYTEQYCITASVGTSSHSNCLEKRPMVDSVTLNRPFVTSFVPI